ncbi:hypothetical protein [Neptuniibacter sp.]|uniref:hypothetical protein n=1 Tax=Neptuniibacter sp. TaxID=1962643 RepID=UPI002604385E|nr:hypothetical protein [Neptuniibacter sp.]MCP4595441.1 hypothetical protein [Neptuniibacter sp.]
MISHYMQYEIEFNQLAQMLVDEADILIVFPDDEKCNISENLDQSIMDAVDQRCNEYVKSFKLLGLEWAYSGDEPLYLSVHSEGLSVSAIRRGYSYTSDPLDLRGEVVESTEGTCKQLPCYRQIDENWYIYLDD